MHECRSVPPGSLHKHPRGVCLSCYPAGETNQCCTESSSAPVSGRFPAVAARRRRASCAGGSASPGGRFGAGGGGGARRSRGRRNGSRGGAGWGTSSSAWRPGTGATPRRRSRCGSRRRPSSGGTTLARAEGRRWTRPGRRMLAGEAAALGAGDPRLRGRAGAWPVACLMLRSGLWCGDPDVCWLVKAISEFPQHNYLHEACHHDRLSNHIETRSRSKNCSHGPVQSKDTEWM